jgi:ribosomal protein S18 acetylase RimI-like enzyme
MKTPLQNIEIRPLVLDDAAEAEALRQLYAFSLGKNARGFVQDISFHGDIALRAGLYRHNNGDMLGVFDDNKMIGMGGIRGKDEARVELCNLHLLPECQGRGIGKQLSLTLIDDAKKRGYKVMELHVTNTQENAIGLYTRLGFKQTHQHVYTIHGVDYDTVFMELALA